MVKNAEVLKENLADKNEMNGVNIISNKLFGINLVLIKNSYGVFGVAVSIVISTLSGLLPANKAAKLDPVDSLRRE